MTVREPRVYIAGPFSARETLEQLSLELRLIGYGLSCRWLSGKHDTDPGVPADAFGTDSRFAAEDLEDIDNCDVLVAFTAASSGILGNGGHSGGRHVETGYALALDKRVVIVGQAENIFHSLGSHRGVHLAGSWHEATLLMAGWLVDDLREMPTEQMVRAG